jgi:hypothetical protein
MMILHYELATKLHGVIFLEQLTIIHLVKKFRCYYRIPMFIIVFINLHYFTLT